MTVMLDQFSVWLPGRGVVLSAVSAELTGVTLLVGRSGCGTTTLLRALGGRLAAETRLGGSITMDGVPLDDLVEDELAGLVDASHLAELPERPVRRLLDGTDDELIAAFGLDRATAVDRLTTEQRAAVRLLRALARPGSRLVLLDQPLVDLMPSHRPIACAAIRARAERGSTVVWAEHLIEEALPSADQVVEFLGPDRLEVGTVAAWQPRTLPAPPAMALVRAASPRPRRRRRETGDLVATADPGKSRLDRPVELRAGECLGIVSTSSDRVREIDVARRLTAIARGEATLAPALSWPQGVPVGRIAASWEQTHGAPAGTVASYVEPLVRLDPHRTPRQHSTGEVAALGWALALSRPGPRLLIDPSRGLDPAARRHLATELFADTDTVTVLVSGDLELLSRACHRVLVIDHGAVVADGAPMAVLEQLPHLPQLARLGARALHVAELSTHDTGAVPR